MKLTSYLFSPEDQQSALILGSKSARRFIAFLTRSAFLSEGAVSRVMGNFCLALTMTPKMWLTRHNRRHLPEQFRETPVPYFKKLPGVETILCMAGDLGLHHPVFTGGVLFVWPDGEKPLTALTKLEISLRQDPAAAAGADISGLIALMSEAAIKFERPHALLAAEVHGQTRLTVAAALSSQARPPLKLESVGQKRLEALADELAVPDAFGPNLLTPELPPLLTVDRVRLLIEIGRRMWDEARWPADDTAARLRAFSSRELENAKAAGNVLTPNSDIIVIRHQPTDAELLAMESELLPMDAAALLEARPAASLAGVRLRLPISLPIVENPWTNWIMCRTMRLTPEDVKHLCPDGEFPSNGFAGKLLVPLAGANRELIGELVSGSGRPAPDNSWTPTSPLPPGASRDTLDRMIAANNALIREADEKAVFSPRGYFSLRLPPGMPLRHMGFTRVRVMADEDRLLTRLESDGVPTGPITEWKPTVFLFSPGMSLSARAWLLLALAALWHDLRVAGEASILPERDDDYEGAAPPPASDQPRRPAAPSQESVLYLPRKLYTLEITGRRQWSTHAERAVLETRLRQFPGFTRRLAAGWKRSAHAEELAAYFGVVLPDGRTFVKPHTRNVRVRGDAPEQKPITVISRGLGTLVAIAATQGADETQDPDPDL